jgi:hypothetical protein
MTILSDLRLTRAIYCCVCDCYSDIQVKVRRATDGTCRPIECSIVFWCGVQIILHLLRRIEVLDSRASCMCVFTFLTTAEIRLLFRDHFHRIWL